MVESNKNAVAVTMEILNDFDAGDKTYDAERDMEGILHTGDSKVLNIQDG